METLYGGKGFLELPCVSMWMTPFQIKKEKLLENMLLLIQYGVIGNDRCLSVPLGTVTATVLLFRICMYGCFATCVVVY